MIIYRCSFRPATACGYSERLRLDLSVNILTNFGFHKNYIKVFGGKQLRPNYIYWIIVMLLLKLFVPKKK